MNATIVHLPQKWFVVLVHLPYHSWMWLRNENNSNTTIKTPKPIFAKCENQFPPLNPTNKFNKKIQRKTHVFYWLFAHVARFVIHHSVQNDFVQGRNFCICALNEREREKPRKNNTNDAFIFVWFSLCARYTHTIFRMTIINSRLFFSRFIFIRSLLD